MSWFDADSHLARS